MVGKYVQTENYPGNQNMPPFDFCAQYQKPLFNQCTNMSKILPNYGQGLKKYGEDPIQ